MNSDMNIFIIQINNTSLSWLRRSFKTKSFTYKEVGALTSQSQRDFRSKTFRKRGFQVFKYQQ